MSILDFIWTNGAAFLFILTVIVFVHELGHYLVARRNGVRIEVFSVGFGPELCGWTDRAGTRWKISMLPLGGYVKMFGERGATGPGAMPMSDVDRAVSFHHKTVGQRAAIVAAGPVANFLLAILILSVMFSTVGQPFTPADIAEVAENSPAEAAGLRAGDVVTRIDGTRIARFEDIQQIVRLNPGVPLKVTVNRDGREMVLTAVPQSREMVDRFGNRQMIGQLGISRSGGTGFMRHDPFSAVAEATEQTFTLSYLTLQAVGQIIAGSRSAEDLGGPIRIAQMSGQVAESSLLDVFWFLAVLSINLGLINLFPVPMLDGGHLLFYGAEAIRGRPLSERVIEYGFRVGLGLVLTLFVFVTYQDLMRFEGVVAFFKGLVT